MIPFFQIPSLSIFDLEFHPFFILVGIGFAAGTYFAARRAEKVGLDPDRIYTLAILYLLFGFFGAHLLHILENNPGELRTNPLAIFYIWGGISSFGGFLGAGLATWIYFRKKNLPALRYTDAFMFGFWPGWTIARLGCFVAHDHRGHLTDFFMAVQFPSGTRHDVGLYDAILAGSITLLLYVVIKKRALPPGVTFVICIIAYCVPRFFLDFLRATDLPNSDERYGYLTPGQYAAIVLPLFALYLLKRAYKKIPKSTSAL